MALIPVECSESKEAGVARSDHHCCTRVGQPADLRKTGARSTRQRCKIFAPGLQSGLGPTCLRSALKERAAWHSRVRRGACLRARFTALLGKANHPSGLKFICRCNTSLDFRYRNGGHTHCTAMQVFLPRQGRSHTHSVLKPTRRFRRWSTTRYLFTTRWASHQTQRSRPRPRGAGERSERRG